MNCPFCQTENPDSAVYCKQCGRPMNGKLTCPACGEEVAPDSNFCTRCGTRLTPVPAPASDGAASAPSQESAKAKPRVSWRSVLTYIGGGCAMFAALCAVIFTFCLGCSVSGGGITELLDIRGVDLYYYFGGAYSDLDAALSDTVPTLYALSLYCNAAFGTLLAAAAFIAVPVLFIVTLVRYILSFFRPTKSVISMAAKTYFVYLAFALLFLGLQAAQIHVSTAMGSVVSMNYDVSVIYNGATIAGIVLGAVGIALSAACNAIGRGAENTQKPRILQLSFYGAAAVLVCVAVSLLGGCLTELLTEEAGSSIRLSFGFMQALSLVGNLDLSFGQTTSLIEAYPTESMMAFASAVLGFVFLIVLLILAAILLASLVRGIGDGTAAKGRPMKYAILCTVFAVLLTVCAAILVSNTASLINLANWGTAIPFQTNFAPAIAAAVLLAVALVLLIVCAALSPSEKRKRD